MGVACRLCRLTPCRGRTLSLLTFFSARPLAQLPQQQTTVKRQIASQVEPKVEILAGKDIGKQGLITCIIKERNWCFVEGLNCRYKALNKSATSPGQMSKEEKPLLVTTEVALVDPSDNQSTAVEWRFTEEGDRVRVSVRTGRIIPLSKIAENTTDDFVDKRSYRAQDKDTTEADIKKITFKPKLATFEQDIMEIFGIKDDRKRAKTYWY